MFKSTFIFLFLFGNINLSFGQSNLLSLDYRFGAPAQFKPQEFGIFKGYEYRTAENLFDQGLVVNYSHGIWKKFLLYGNIGFDLSRTKRYQSIVEFQNNRHIDNIILNDNRFDIHFGLEKKFSLFDSKVMFNVGWRLVIRNSFKQSTNYTSEFKTFDYKNGSIIKYDYDLTTYHGEFHKNPAGINQTGKIGNDFFTGVNIRMTDQLFFNFNLNFTTHNIFYYDYTYHTLYYTDGVKVADIQYHGFLSEHKFGVKDNFFYVSTGISFELGKK